MLTFACTFIGMALGAATLGEFGLIWGGSVGFLIGRIIRLQRNLAELNAIVQVLQTRLGVVADSTGTSPVTKPPARDVPAVAPDNAWAEDWSDKDDAPVPEVAARPAVKTPAPKTMPAAPTKVSASPPPTDWPKPPDAADGIVLRLVKDYFTGGNTLVRVGIIILFIGMAFLAKYAADRGIVPIELRMAGLGLAGLVLLVLGWRLRAKRTGYAMALQGGGIGITYLTLFASFRLYHLLPSGMAFGLMFAVCVLSAVIAVLMNSRSLAILGFAFGFLTPILTSTGGGSHVMLFSYYTVLNVGILGIAWFKSWRLLNLVGFVFTFAIGTLWGVTRYEPDMFASTEPFLIGFFLFYVTISILYAVKQSVNLKGYVDGTLVFGTPIIVFSLQAALVRNMEYGLTYSALALFSFYVLLASALFRLSDASKARQWLRLLCESFLATGIVFGTVAIPLALDDQWTAAAWALEGAALIYVAIRQQRDLAYFCGILLQLGAAVFVIRTFMHVDHEVHWPLLNGIYINGLIMAVAGIFSAYLSFRHHACIKRYVADTDRLLLYWGTGWWLFSGIYENIHHATRSHHMIWLLMLGALTAVLGHVPGARLSWPGFKKLERTLVVFMILAVAGSLLTLRHPFAHANWLAWLGVFPVYYAVLKRMESALVPAMRAALHGWGIWIATFLLTWEAAWQVDRALTDSSAWWLAVCLLLPSAVLVSFQFASCRITWPFQQHRATYLGVASYPVVVFILAAVFVGAIAHSGNPNPLPYIPLFNPLDLASVMAILSVLGWWLAIRPLRSEIIPRLEQRDFLGLIAALVFLIINGALLKTIHHWYHVPLTVDALMQSELAQMALTILWSVTALAAMLMASKQQWRTVWLVASGLLAVVVIKLFVLDLANVGTVERIVSFIFVGGLMLVIGYFSPIPTKAKDV